jgi:hypothetical protein
MTINLHDECPKALPRPKSYLKSQMSENRRVAENKIARKVEGARKVKGAEKRRGGRSVKPINSVRASCETTGKFCARMQTGEPFLLLLPSRSV